VAVLFLRAAVAGCACFPGTPAEERIHIKMGKEFRRSLSEKRAARQNP
ncbi:hypothetical protein MNBD_ALPHA12-1713, partial [hydrothermal vent metagenome]